MANDTFTITLDALTKTATYIGKLSIKNTFDITVINIGDATPTDLELQVYLKGVTDDLYAQIDAGDFSASGANAVAELNLNTAALTTYFANLPHQREVDFTFVLQDTSDNDLLMNFPAKIMNNPYDAGSTPPSTPGNAVTVSGATVVGELAFWASTAGVLDNSGYGVDKSTGSLQDSDTQIPTSKLVKATTDALSTLITALDNGKLDNPGSLSRGDMFFVNSAGAITKVTGAKTAGFAPLINGSGDIEFGAPTYSGAGDVLGPGSSTNGNITSFTGATGKVIADSGVAVSVIAANTAAIATNTTHRGLTNNPHSVTNTQVGLGNVVNTLNKFDATVAPTVNEDSDDGYSVGSQWVDVTADATYFCQDATVGAAVWVQMGSGSGSLEDVMSLYA